METIVEKQQNVQTSNRARITTKKMLLLVMIFVFLFVPPLIHWLINVNNAAQLDWVLKPKYDTIYDFKNGRSYIEKNNEGAFVDDEGSVRPVDRENEKDKEYLKSTLCLSTNSAKHLGDMLYGLNNLYGDVFSEVIYDQIFGLSEKIIVAQKPKGMHYGDYKITSECDFFDQYGKLLFQLEGIEEIHGFSEGLALIKQGELYGYMDQMGKIVIEPQFQIARQFSDGYAAVAINLANEGEQPDCRWGFINQSGDLVIDYKYYSVGDFGEGLVAFSSEYVDIKPTDSVATFQKLLHGYMDVHENILIEPQYFSARKFSNGVAIAVPRYYSGPGSMYKPNLEYHVCIINKTSEKLLLIARPEDFEFEDAQGGYIRTLKLSTMKYGLIKNPAYL